MAMATATAVAMDMAMAIAIVVAMAMAMASAAAVAMATATAIVFVIAMAGNSLAMQSNDGQMSVNKFCGIGFVVQNRTCQKNTSLERFSLVKQVLLQASHALSTHERKSLGKEILWKLLVPEIIASAH